MRDGKKRFILIALALIFIAGISISAIFSANERVVNTGPELKKGKNYVKINSTYSFLYAKELVIMNPDIEYISYYDSFLNKSIGYVNVFGGIGTNFLIDKNRVYEISVKRNITLIT